MKGLWKTAMNKQVSGKEQTVSPGSVGLRTHHAGRSVGSGIFWFLLVTGPFWLSHVGGYTQLGTRVLVYGFAAMSLNLLLGFTGGLSFGHAAYFGLGAYGAGLTLKFLAPSTPLALFIGTFAGGLAATLLGPAVMRRRGIYFAMITIAIGQLFYFIAVRWNSVTGGEDGLAGFERQPIHFGSHTLALGGTTFYYLVLILFAAGVVVMRSLLNSPLGHTWLAIRENQKRARFLGIRVDLYVWASFAISGTLIALAGALNALLNNFTSPQDLHWILSGDFVIMVVLGGMRSFWGPLVGAIIFLMAQDYLSSITGNWMTFIGLIFVVVVLVFPNGLLGLFDRRGGDGMSNLLRLEEISRTFGHLLALQKVSFDMNEGELLAVIGPNGAGKTTLFNLVSGFFEPTRGIVWFQDRNINRLSTVERVHNGIVRTFQITEIFPDMTVFENVRIGVEASAGCSRRPWISAGRRKAINTRIAELLETTGLADKAYRVVSELAHGDQRVVEVAMALSLKPHLLLLDEPTAGMGDEETDRMIQLISQLHREQGLSIVFIEHDMNIVFGIAERIVVLDQGQVIAEGTAETISTDRDVQRAYLGEER